jgi:hypothetical protein
VAYGNSEVVIYIYAVERKKRENNIVKDDSVHDAQIPKLLQNVFFLQIAFMAS